MSVEAIKKALEGVTHAPGKWEADGTAVYCDDATGQRVCDTKGEYLFWSEDQKRDAAVYIAAVNPAAISELLSTLESLQRENEELRKDKAHIAAEKAGIAKNAHSNVDYWKSQAEAAEAEVKRLREALKPFAEIEPINVYESEDEDANGRYILTENQFRFARQALASTGGEHNGN